MSGNGYHRRSLSVSKSGFQIERRFPPRLEIASDSANAAGAGECVISRMSDEDYYHFAALLNRKRRHNGTIYNDNPNLDKEDANDDCPI